MHARCLDHLRPDPDVHVELVRRLARRTDSAVLDAGVPLDVHACRVKTHEGLLVSRDRFAVDNVFSFELREIVEIGREVDPLVSLPITVPEQPSQIYCAIHGIRWIGCGVLHERILAPTLIVARSSFAVRPFVSHRVLPLAPAPAGEPPSRLGSGEG
ncbi:hypothetical protein GCM10010350_79110 [Streptomyces galilaeus]|nr:hypothetical protein GCM10010350_79110 [Streptomyces galilaeus]